MKHIQISTLVLAVFLTVFSPAQAQTNNKFSLSITPTYHEVVINNAERQKEVEFQLFNNTPQDLQVRVFPIDIKQQDITGKIEYIEDKTKRNPFALASHIKITESTVSIPAQKSIKVHVTITNDDDLFPGGHYAAIISQAQYVNAESQPVLIPALTTQLFVRKTGGERAGLNLLSFNFPKWDVTFLYPRTTNMLFQNVGNIHLTPYGLVEVKDIFGRRVYKGIINEASLKILPQTKREIPVSFMKLAWNLPFSINTVKVEGTDSLNVVSFATTSSFLYINPWFLLSIVIFPAIFILYRKVVQKRKNEK